MPLLHVTDTHGTARCAASGMPASEAISTASDTAPLTIMVHGYKYAPYAGRNCPHVSLFAPQDTDQPERSASWPVQLARAGLTAQHIVAGFGWSAQGPLHQTYTRAGSAGQSLARMITQIRHQSPARPIRIIAHSLGARVALQAIAALPPGSVRLAILMAGAEYAGVAQMALRNRETPVLNVTSKENALFDGLARVMMGGSRGPMLGAGLDTHQTLTLRIDCPDMRKALAQLGYPIAPPQGLVCHWSVYLRAGVWPLYAALLGGTLPLSLLESAIADHSSAKRDKPRGLWAPRPA